MFFRHLDNASLANRLGLGLAVGLIVIFLLQTAAIFLIASRLAEQNVLDHLQHESETLLAMSEFKRGQLQLNAPLHALQYHRPFSGHYYQLQSQKDQRLLRSRSLWDARLPDVHLPVGGTFYQHQKKFGQSLLILYSTYERDGQAISITVAEEMDHQNRLTTQLMIADAIVFAIAVLLLWWWQHWTLHRAMMVLQRLRQDMQELWDGRRERLQNSQTPVELAPLIEEFNAMIERLQHRMLRTRTALGDLAHSLKTPLACLHQLLNEDLNDEHQRQRLRQASDQIHDRIERELRIAQLAGIKATPGCLQLHDEAKDLLHAMRMLYADKELNLICPEQLKLMADREDIVELLGNLLDNACKWANSRAMLRLSYGLDALHIIVEDDGPGIPEAALPILQQRGKRLDEQKSGHGLGLSIVAAVIREYNGDWQITRSDALGGASILVTLPIRKSS